MTDVSIRPMRVADFGDVYELGLQCYDVLDKPYNYWSIREVADHLEGNPGLCFVAEADGRVVGFTLGDASFEILEDTGHLEWIAVAPEYRRRGVAARLIDRAVETFRELGKKRVVADIASGNAASRAMAARTGFTEGISVTYWAKELEPD